MLIWWVLLFFMSTMVFAVLRDRDLDAADARLNMASFFVGVNGMTEYPADASFRRAWSSRIGATVPARAWMMVFADMHGQVRADTAATAMAVWGAGLFLAAQLVVLYAFRNPLVVCLVFVGVLWLELWQHHLPAQPIHRHLAWDFPALLAFTVCFALMAKRREVAGIVVAAAAVSIKLTSIVWVAAIPFVPGWSVRKKGVVMGVGVALGVVVKLCCDLIAGNQLLLTPTPVIKSAPMIIQHLEHWSHLTLKHPLFLGGGLLLGFLLTARHAAVWVIAVVVSYFIGQLLFAAPGEYSVFLEIVPVWAAVVGERLSRSAPMVSLSSPDLSSAE